MSEATTLDHGLPQHAVDRLRDVFRRWPQIERVILYGSRAKGNFRRGSDIDLCVVGEDLGVSDLLKLDGEIDDLVEFGRRRCILGRPITDRRPRRWLDDRRVEVRLPVPVGLDRFV
ncbi:MAG: nucleotidyltransferase domain-containing protein, partial [Thiohalorhabdaceae bacterium]